jgi:pyruvate kinase
MNFSHGDYEYHQSVIDNTRKMVEGMDNLSQIGQSVDVGLPADPSGRPVAIALDTVGYYHPSSFARPLI